MFSTVSRYVALCVENYISDTQIIQVRIAEESPKKLRVKSYFRDRANSREVLQGSSFFNDLVKRSSIQKERISTEGLATHHETSSPKRYRDRKILKRDDVFSGNR